MNLFSPKDIILNAIKDKLLGTGITKVTVVFDLKTDRYSLLFTDESGKKNNIELLDNEISIVKKVFIKKIVKKYKQTSNKEIKSVILRINFDQVTEKVDLYLFIETIDKNVEPINF
jgi:hypothetical protein